MYKLVPYFFGDKLCPTSVSQKLSPKPYRPRLLTRQTVDRRASSGMVLSEAFMPNHCTLNLGMHKVFQNLGGIEEEASQDLPYHQNI
jgi:hypothetical protein